MRKSSHHILHRQNMTLMQKCWTIWDVLIKNKRNIYHVYTQNGREKYQIWKQDHYGQWGDYVIRKTDEGNIINKEQQQNLYRTPMQHIQKIHREEEQLNVIRKIWKNRHIGK